MLFFLKPYPPAEAASAVAASSVVAGAGGFAYSS